MCMKTWGLGSFLISKNPSHEVPRSSGRDIFDPNPKRVLEFSGTLTGF